MRSSEELWAGVPAETLHSQLGATKRTAGELQKLLAQP